jgi:hypothetical protein
VGAYAVRLARQAGLHVVATTGSADLEYVRRLGAERVADYRGERFEESLTGVDVVLDTVGGETQLRSLRVLKRGGILVSIVSPVPETTQKAYGVRAACFYVDVTTARPNQIAALFDSRKLVADVGTVLPLGQASTAHEMLGGVPHPRGKIVVLLHHHRQVVHFNVTEFPTAAWAAQQLVEAFPDDSAPRYLLRDRDSIYGGEFRRRVKGMGIAELLTAPGSPWQNPFAERVIDTIRRELLKPRDHPQRATPPSSFAQLFPLLPRLANASCA